MKSEDDIRNCTTGGMPNEYLKNSKLAEEHYEKVHIRNINTDNLYKPFDNLKKRTFGEEDLFGGYESPIRLIASQVEMKMENDVLQAIQRYNIQVDKDELIKALNYDRQQYEKGVADTKSKLKPMCKYLGKCMSHPDIDRTYHDWCALYQEDCNCQCCNR